MGIQTISVKNKKVCLRSPVWETGAGPSQRLECMLDEENQQGANVTLEVNKNIHWEMSMKM